MSITLTGTLKKIKDSGTITISHHDSSIPFSYLDRDSSPIGYSHDVQMLVVDHLKKVLSLPNLQICHLTVTSRTRIPMLGNGTLDLEGGSTSNNLERQRQVAFSTNIFEVSIRFLTKVSDGQPSYKDIESLGGKTVVTTSDTTSERILKMMNAEKQLGINLSSVNDHNEAVMWLLTGRAVALVPDDVLLEGLRSNIKTPKD